MNALRLQAFLYLLMRDELPTGKVAAIVEELRMPVTSHDFSGNPLAEYALSLAKQILEN